MDWVESSVLQGLYNMATMYFWSQSIAEQLATIIMDWVESSVLQGLYSMATMYC